MEYYGHVGNVLHVDLSTGGIRKEPLDASLARKLIGGQGVGLRLLLDLLKPNVDPLSPENPLVFGTGPLLGTLVPGSGKCYLSTKYAMPASADKKKYFVSTSMFGSRRFGAMMKNAGYDHIVVTGRAEKPSYLKVTDENVEICDASDLWGKDIYETGSMLRDRHRGRTGACGVWAIGKAGENLVRFALGFTDDLYNAGRFAGAVAGSKNLKAIVTLGAKGISVADRKQFMDVYGKKRTEILSLPNHQPLPVAGESPAAKLFTETVVSIKGCSGSMCACKSINEAKEGRFKGQTFGGSWFGEAVESQRRLQLSELGEVFKLLDVMNRYGLCMFTTRRMIWFITKLYERGIISAKDTGGLALKVGDFDSYLALVEKIVNREDIGAIIAEGWYPLCEKLGVDAATDFEDGCSIIKGVDTLLDVRFWPSLFSPAIGLAMVVHAKTKHVHAATYWGKGPGVELPDVRRDCEKMGLLKEEIDRMFTEDSFNTGRLTMYSEDVETLYSALGICDTVLNWEYGAIRDVPWLAEVYSAVTGYEITPRELLRAAERIRNLERLLNVREGFTREDDKIPALYLQNIETPVKTRRGDRYLMDWFGRRLTEGDLQAMLDDYYEERGWDIERGVPTKRKLIELGLEEFVQIV